MKDECRNEETKENSDDAVASVVEICVGLVTAEEVVLVWGSC